ncbi:pectin lyase fold/virulence factor [Aspergillus minisclerotigenes]|uniref:Pectin lyase fold/virulence factor n=1 Tax=Aspergillus minisclerotigenes TaxID=656917 RepID=A0A5N6JCT9_9EURO|nr:pectin lyase fold/virulence factor [Aspergillus minisclerotigenes]
MNIRLILPCIMYPRADPFPRFGRYRYYEDRALEERIPACTPVSAGSASVDDAPSIYDAIKQCGNGGTIVIPEGKTFNIRGPLNFSECASCEFQLEGSLKFSDDLTFWNGTKAMIEVFNVNGLRFHSLTGSGLIDANGQAAWESFATDTSLRRPTMLMISNSTDILLDNYKAQNPQGVFYSVGSQSARIAYSNLDLSAVSRSSTQPKNTDGFDIGDSTYVTVDNVNVVNQDDCIAFKAGLNYLTVQNVTCDGSHGLSVGSLAKYADNVDTVQNVYVRGAVMKNSTKAAGIKIYPGGTEHGYGIVTNITWEDITVDNCDYAFQVSACYNEDESYCEENPSNSTITGITLKNFHGTTTSRYSPTVAQFFCPVEGAKCQVQVDGWNVDAGSGTARVDCDNISSSTLGIDCTQTTAY